MHPCPMFPRVCGRGETYLEPGAALLHCHVMVGQWTVAASILTLILPWDDTVFREGSFSLFIIENLIQHFCTSRHRMHLIFAKQVISMIMLGCLSVNLLLHWSLQTSVLLLYGDNLNSVFIIKVCLQHLVFEQHSYCYSELSCLLSVIGWTGSH